MESTGSPEAARPSAEPERPLSPLQDEVLRAGAVFDPDPMIAATLRPDLAPEAGYGEHGPGPLGGPTGDTATVEWSGPVPVFQWEIDPSSPQRHRYGEAESERDGWLFRTWWQVHSASLVYASISAIPDEDAEDRSYARPHPVGRNVAVNLVYDLRRHGIVAVYGTAQDFRPFVEVFLEGFGVSGSRPDRPGETSSAQESTS